MNIRASRASTRRAPKYLVFDGSSEQPACVVEFGETGRLAAVEKVLAELSPRLPQTVPATLRCAHWKEGTSVHVQQGLPGTPWFRLSDQVNSRDAWVALLERASKVLASFHGAVREVPAWVGLVYPGMELRRQAMLSRFRGVTLSERALQRVEQWSVEADRGGALDGCCQHGDFSLNNLLVSPSSIAIIDFDEFGRTRVPAARRLRAGALGPAVAGGPLPADRARVHPAVRHRLERRRRGAARSDACAADAPPAVARQPVRRPRASRAAAPRPAPLDRRTRREPRSLPGRTRVTRPVPFMLDVLDRVFPPNPSAFMSSAEQTAHESVKATETMGSYLAELGDTKDLDILDYGCGWGGETLWVARRVRSACGVDVDAKAIAQAQSALATSGARNCRFELSPDGRLPFPDASFDAVLFHRHVRTRDGFAARVP
jgi:hypothetical protein